MGAHEYRGLSVDEAARRLAADGPNELPGTRERRLLAIVVDVLTEPMLLLLMAAAGVYSVLGDAGEAMAIAASMLIVIAISIVQERRTEHALARLRDLSSPRALVVRDGKEQRIAGRDVVQGDTVIIHEGDRVPADAVVVTANELSVDESILTGESLPVDKIAAAPESTHAEQAERDRVYSGSLVVRGAGVAQVFATGSRSQIGRIGKALDALQTETTPLYREIRQMVRWAAFGGLTLCAVVAATYALTRDDWLGGALAGITLAMGLLPEEFPVVLTIFLALGAWRLSRLKVLTRRMPAIETIGAVTVLAVDKTGTLTENRMRVALLQADTEICDLRRNDALTPASAQVLSIALAASKIDAFDPMERAIQDAAATLIDRDAAERRRSQLVREYGLTPQLLAVTYVWRKPNADALEVTVKGAPEAVFRLCRLSASEREMRLAQVATLASDGLRVLGVAHGQCSDGDLPESPYSFDLRLVGLICLADPLRADVPAAMNECRRAGIRVVMITGDHPGTALAIARRAGLTDSDAVLTGAELNALDEETLRERARTTSIYARMSPEHKLRLVHTLKANGEIVAMTGDGVNDAPALKAAHVGVAMGGRGTDVAREAASIVLLNDDFASLVAAVRSGRRIYENLRHAMAFVIAVHVPIAGMGLLPVLLGWPLLLFPLHVLVLEFVIDPACTFVFEADEQDANIMDRPPRSTKARLFSGALLRRSFSMGSVILAIAFAVYALALSSIDENAARALSFIGLIAAAVALIFVNRAPDSSFTRLLRRPNKVFWIIVCGATIVIASVLYIPALAEAFRFTAPSLPLILAVLIGAAAGVVAAGMLARHDRPEKLQTHVPSH